MQNCSQIFIGVEFAHMMHPQSSVSFILTLSSTLISGPLPNSPKHLEHLLEKELLMFLAARKPLRSLLKYR